MCEKHTGNTHTHTSTNKHTKPSAEISQECQSKARTIISCANLGNGDEKAYQQFENDAHDCQAKPKVDSLCAMHAAKTMYSTHT